MRSRKDKINYFARFFSFFPAFQKSIFRLPSHLLQQRYFISLFDANPFLCQNHVAGENMSWRHLSTTSKR